MSVAVLDRLVRPAPPRAAALPITLRGVTKRFGNRAVIADLDLHVPAGQFLAIVGRSGCGKSTLLRLLSGLDAPDSGTIRYGDGDAPSVRLMFQEPRLLPWAKVTANVEIGLGEGEADTLSKALAALRDVGLEDWGDKWPATLSGGQKQRVALARALVSRPRVLALDEPLGALDALTRIEMQHLVERVYLIQGFTAVLVTHDVTEALALADRVIMLEKGGIALDETVSLPRPRRRGSAEAAALEARILSRLLWGKRLMTVAVQSMAATPTEPAFVLTSNSEAIAVAEALAAAFALEASGRDHDRRLPWVELDRFSQSGLWAMNVPKAYGGPGLSYATVARVFAIIASADASIAQIAQNHISLVDTIRFDPDESRKRFLLGEALRGIRFGNALSERGGKTVLEMQTRITRVAGHHEITGRKFYATGALYAHLVPVHALDDEGRAVLAFVARDAPGLTIVDDWSGFGQRTTGSGTVTLDKVRVADDHVVPGYRAFDRPTLHGAIAQIIHAGIDAGLAHGTIQATIAFVRDHARPWADSGKDKASDDPFTIREIADLKVKLHAAEAVLKRAGRVIDAGLLDENAETAAAASIAVAEAKVLTTEIAILAANKLFELSGTRSVLSELNLDRFWRDARVHTLHDPVRWKFFAIGDYVVNGTKPPRHSWI